MQLNDIENNLKKNPLTAEIYTAILDLEENEVIVNPSVYHEFPIYREENEIIQSQILLTAKNKGVISIGFCELADGRNVDPLHVTDNNLEDLHGLLMSRFIKNPALREKRSLIFVVENIIYAPGVGNLDGHACQSLVATSIAGIKKIIGDLEEVNLSDDQYLELQATLEGSKALFKPKSRKVPDELPEGSIAKLVEGIEQSIAIFDRQQKLGYMSVLDGPQRIRGLAGSGKTVILSMKAALTHLRNPEAVICFTFHTKSLYQHVKRLITRFYRQFDDRDPDWEKIIIQHAWGGSQNPGVYSRACQFHGVRPLTFADAQKSRAQDVFGYVCKVFLENVDVRPMYDYMFIDEAQDFDAYFLRMCLNLTDGNKVVWGADELQNIFQTSSISYAEIRGIEGERNFVKSQELEKDWILKTCYRTPREVLVCAHAMGFGLYGQIVQMLENREHWEGLGYEVIEAEYKDDEKNEFLIGSEILIFRPEENSPRFINKDIKIDDIISCQHFAAAGAEIDFVHRRIYELIKNEFLLPSDILVVCVDDRNATVYLDSISEKLSNSGINVNNIHSDKYGIRDFFEEGRVTLSTVHKAKGNEAYIVFVVGIDAVSSNASPKDKNIIFTAMTRTKGWLYMSGVGEKSKIFCDELAMAKNNFPFMKFKMPTEGEYRKLKRDLLLSNEEKFDSDLDRIQGEIPLDEMERVLQKRIAMIRKIKKKEEKKF
jgi:superfamily I DNA and RNA helicase